jgi:hypothetical protein
MRRASGRGMGYPSLLMRRSTVVATVALIATLALAGQPVTSGSTSTGPQAVEPAAFTQVNLPAADVPAPGAQGVVERGPRTDSNVSDETAFVDPGAPPRVNARRPRVDQPASPTGSDWKPPLYTLSGYATFYDAGTTAMRLPLGTVVRICGKGGCIQRTVTDYGPSKTSRVVDMYRPDFFKVCGCESWSGTAWVTVSVY